LGRSEAEERLLATIDVIPSRKYKKRHLKSLTPTERTNIIHEYLVESMSRDDVARRFRISVNLVSSLVSKIKKNPNMLQELKSKKEAQTSNHQLIRDTAT
jgi:DNA-binding CsgD family transcriptional regulator